MGVGSRDPRRRVRGVAAFVGLGATLPCGALPGHLADELRVGLLFLGPALLLAIALLARRCRGDRAIERWRARRSSGAGRLRPSPDLGARAL